MSDITNAADAQALAKEVLLNRLLSDSLESLCRAEIQRLLSTPEGKAQLQQKTQLFLRDLLAEIFPKGQCNANQS